MINSPSVTDAERSRAIRLIKYLLFSATLVPAALAGGIALSRGSLRISEWLLAAFGLLIGQAGGDYLYYYFTHYHTDSRDAHTKIFAGWRPLFTPGWIPQQRTLLAGIFCLALDALIGLYFLSRYGLPVLWLALAGAAAAFLFTPLMLRGLKEPVVFLTFGPLCLYGMVYVLTGDLSPRTVLISLPVGFLVTIVAYLKGARYRVEEENGSAIVMRLDVRILAGLLAAAYLSILAGVLLGWFTPWALLTALTIPQAADFTRKAARKKTIADYLWLTVAAQIVFIETGLLLTLSFLLPKII